MNLIARISALALLAFASSGCNHFFYYPSDAEFWTPKKFDIPYDKLTIPSSDGVELAAWWLHPPQEQRLQRLVVQFHGNGENMSSHFLYVAWLAKRGYDVLTFDYRGYGRSSSEPPTRKGLVEDSCHLLQWLQAHPDLGQLPSFIFAQSLGGAVATASLAHCSSPQLRGLVIDSSFASYRTIARRKIASFWLSWPLQIPLSWLISEDEDPGEAIAQLKLPLLFFHSPADPVVPYDLGRALYERATAPKRFIDVKEPGHTRAFAREHGPYERDLIDFFDAHAR